MEWWNEIGAWGNLNAIVYLKCPTTKFHSLVRELADDFEAIEINLSLFHLEPNIEDYGKFDDFGDAVIGRAILTKGREQIHIEQLGDLCSVQHLFRPSFVEDETGSSTMRHVINENPIIGWVLGFELSLHLQDVRKSFDIVWADPSQYPLIVFEQGFGNTPKEYGAYEPMLIKLRAYLARIS